MGKQKLIENKLIFAPRFSFGVMITLRAIGSDLPSPQTKEKKAFLVFEQNDLVGKKVEHA